MNRQSKLWGAAAPPSLVIFDLDGTLVDSLADLAASVNFMRAGLTLPPLTVEQVRNAIGKGARNLVTRCLPEGDERIEPALKIFLEHNEKNLAVNSTLYPGMRELLSALDRAGIAMTVVTNKNSLHSRLLLTTLGIDSCFREILGGDAVKNCKPSPEPLLEAIARCGASAATTVMIGDSINDFAAAAAAGVRSIGCRFGYGEAWEFEQATVCIESATEFLPLPWLK